MGIDVKTCQEKCKERKDCRWYSYNKRFELCIIWETCKTLNDDTVYISGQSECSDSQHKLDNPELDNPEDDNPEFDNPKVDSPYKCNLTGMCQVSYKPTVYDHNMIIQTS